MGSHIDTVMGTKNNKCINKPKINIIEVNYNKKLGNTSWILTFVTFALRKRVSHSPFPLLSPLSLYPMFPMFPMSPISPIFPLCPLCPLYIPCMSPVCPLSVPALSLLLVSLMFYFVTIISLNSILVIVIIVYVYFCNYFCLFFCLFFIYYIIYFCNFSLSLFPLLSSISTSPLYPMFPLSVPALSLLLCFLDVLFYYYYFYYFCLLFVNINFVY